MGKLPPHRPHVHYPGLNGMRFIAVMLVLVGHFQTHVGLLGMKPLMGEALSTHLGVVGVTIFFTLSGFLITSLLIREREHYGTVHVGKFYLRRMLRIWPLYYLFLLACFFLFPLVGGEFSNPGGSGDLATSYWGRFALFSLLLPNVAFVFLPIMPYAFVLWSVGVEEQFYLFWPHLIKRIKPHQLLKWLLALLGLLMAVKMLFILLNSQSQGGFQDAVILLDRTRFSCMVIGGISAVLLHSSEALLRWVFAIKTQALAWVSVLLLAVLAEPFSIPVLHQELVACFCAIVLMNLSSNPKSIVKLENPVWDFLGKITYGMYIWHLPIVVGLLLAAREMWPPATSSGIGFNLLVFLVVVIATILAATASYFGYERIFLRMRRRHSFVLTDGADQKS